jgi:hypothetical protein
MNCSKSVDCIICSYTLLMYLVWSGRESINGTSRHQLRNFR